MVRQPIAPKWRIILGIVSVIIMVMGYTYLSHKQHQANPTDTTIPSWSQLADGVEKMLEVNSRSGERWLVVDSIASVERLFLGLAWGVIGGFLLGLFMGCFQWIAALFVPPISLLAKVPPTAALAVFFVLVGTETPMFVAMIAFGILPVLAMSVYLSVLEFPDELLHKAYTLGASHFEVVWSTIFRLVLPKVFDAVRLQIGPALVYLIAAEMVVGDVGFGYRIRLQSRLLNMDVVYPYLVILAAFGFLVDYGLVRLQRWSCPWYEQARRR